MTYPRIETATVDFGVGKGGDYQLTKSGGVTGRPFPSEGEAWAFDKGLQVMNKFMFMSHQKQLDLLKELGL